MKCVRIAAALGVRWGLIALCAGPAAMLACGGDERLPPPTVDVEHATDAGFLDAGGGGPPPLDASGLCGNALIPIVDERPNLYFVVDHSGSMNLKLDGQTLAEATHSAIFDLLSVIGPHVRYGAAVFPNPTVGECAAGAEVFKLRPGDPPTETGEPGPSLRGLRSALKSAPVTGGTPVSSTFQLLNSTLGKLNRRTYVILATDGGPNCNPERACGADGCQLNIEGASLGDQKCAGSVNCCDPSFGLGAQLSCLDDDPSISAVAALRAKGIDTFVIGMRGSERYQGTLNSLAVAGGRSRATNPRYYPADTPSALSDALIEIGLAVAISCDITLDEAPPDKKLVNLYFDSTLVPSDAVDGWVWIDATHLRLVGAECAKLQRGEVAQVQIVSGCPTEVK